MSPRVALTALAGLTLLASTPLAAQVALSAEHEPIAFLAGDWHTTSEWPDGRSAEGRLQYRWVFGGAWMKVEFHGQHPAGVLWESHVMMRWDPDADGYRSWVFRADGPPLIYHGSVPEPGLFRISHTTADGIVSGIDYRRLDDGTVYQENWVLTAEARRVTLRTRYRRAS
jgi:hypothetical protein